MKQDLEAGRRIVSRAEYFRVQRKRVTTGLGGLTTSLVALVAVCIGGLIVGHTQNIRGLYSLAGWCVFLVFTICAYYLVLESRTLIKKAVQLDPGIPLTRANAADLPVPDSLVRASQEPAQAQEGVLLRASSGESQTGQEEQLLRASTGE